MEINRHICERFEFWVFEGFVWKTNAQNKKPEHSSFSLSGPWFPICKMRGLTLYEPSIGFLTREATFPTRLRIPRAEITWVFFTGTL